MNDTKGHHKCGAYTSQLVLNVLQPVQRLPDVLTAGRRVYLSTNFTDNFRKRGMVRTAKGGNARGKEATVELVSFSNDHKKYVRAERSRSKLHVLVTEEGLPTVGCLEPQETKQKRKGRAPRYYYLDPSINLGMFKEGAIESAIYVLHSIPRKDAARLGLEASELTTYSERSTVNVIYTAGDASVFEILGDSALKEEQHGSENSLQTRENKVRLTGQGFNGFCV